MSQLSPYDALPYPSLTFPQTSPDRLATMATYFGMAPADPAKCRMLELGCGNGANLLSFAYIMPESRFVGIDLAKTHIDDAIKSAGELGIGNIEFLHEDVMEATSERLGEFDYIIAHGLYSWVPDFVREKILKLYSDCLAPHGVGYISYNAYPGCHLRQMIWEMMKYHTASEAEPLKKVEQGTAFLSFLENAAKPDTEYKGILKAELGKISERMASNIYHDEFGDFNQPFYFSEFAGQIKPHGLQYLSESEAFLMSDAHRSAEVRQKLASIENDIIRREQYLDFIEGTPFRSTLICHDSIQLNRESPPSIVEKFFIGSPIRTVNDTPNINNPAPETFVGPKGAKLEINHPLTKAVLVYLGKIWPRSGTFKNILDEARKLLVGNNAVTESDIERTAAFLKQMFEAGFVKLHSVDPPFASEAGEKPEASRFARWQIERGCESMATLTGLSIAPEFDAVRVLISLLDGTRDRDQLAAEMQNKIKVLPDEHEAFVRHLPQMIEENLAKLAAFGILIK